MVHKPKTGWGITTGKPGHEQQVLGVLERLVEEPRIIRVNPTGPAQWFAPWWPAQSHTDVTPPWPDIVITSGRQSAPYARKIALRSKGKTFTAVLQDPKAPPRWFDFMWANSHDKISGENVMQTLTAPHRVTADRLHDDAQRLERHLASSSPAPKRVLSPPFVGVLLGGPNAVFPFSTKEAEEIGQQTAKLANSRGASVLVTPSRRTGEKRLNAFRMGLGSTSHWIWDQNGHNPYFGILGLADEIIATSDSVNMLGETCVTGKPLHMARLQGGSEKFLGFQEALIEEGAARWLSQQSPAWHYNAIDSTADIVSEILRRYDEKRRV